MGRVYNFSAGPSMLPLEVLKRAQAEMLDCNGSGQSVMEMSHRSKEYQAIIDEAESLFREIMNIPDNYKVLFLQGGASTQFSMIPLNLGNKNKRADYVITGQWAKKHIKRHRVSSRRMQSRQVRIRPLRTFPRWISRCLHPVPIMYILHIITQFTERIITQCLISAMR